MNKIGGDGGNLLEPQALTVSVIRKIAWRMGTVDLPELAKLRWVDKWKIERLAAHFEVGTTAIKMGLKTLRKDEVLDGYIAGSFDACGRAD